MTVDRKKTRARDICKGTLDIEFERDWSFSLVATLGDVQKIIKYFSSFRDFSGKTRKFVGLRMIFFYINPQNLIKIVGAIFEKIKCYTFFLCELTYS